MNNEQTDRDLQVENVLLLLIAATYMKVSINLERKLANEV